MAREIPSQTREMSPPGTSSLVCRRTYTTPQDIVFGTVKQSNILVVQIVAAVLSFRMYGGETKFRFFFCFKNLMRSYLQHIICLDD